MGEAEKAAQTRARLLAFHSNNNSMALFYDLYQDERPRTREPNAQQFENSATEQSRAKENRIRGLADHLSPKRQISDRQMEREQQQR